MVRTTAILAASLCTLGAQAAEITQEFSIPWASGPRTLGVSVNPFQPPVGAGPLDSVTIAIEGFAMTRLTASTSFGGTVPVRMTQSFDALAEFADGTDISTTSSTSPVQNFNLSSASPWFSNLTFAGAIFAAPTVYLPGDAAFDRFTGLDPIELSLELAGGTNLISPPTPDFIGATTGAEWIVRVTYGFVPAPGGLALAGIAGVVALRRRR